MKKMLMVATVPSMIGQFNMNNIEMLLDMRYEVHVACNFEDRSVWNEERVLKFEKQLEELGVRKHQVVFSRSVLNLGVHRRSYMQLLEIISKYKYRFVHCHTPIASVICRMATHKKGIKCVYTAHGFHFFSGAPVKNWIVFYPIEKFFSKWTDVLITINTEDFERAKRSLYATKLIKIPGIGVETKKIENISIDFEKKRKELNIPRDAFVLLSVGELQARKNHRVVMEALNRLKESNIYYLIVGQGELLDEYKSLICRYNLENNVKLLGYRNDVFELCKVADCFVHPSIREGLGIAPLEAMASGLPLISSYVNGIKDYTKDEVTGCCIMNPLSVETMMSAITKMYKNREFRQKCASNNVKIALQFDAEITDKIMRQVYAEV